MTASSAVQRLRENATGVVLTLVTGIWLAALFLDQGWWLSFMLFGYVVLVPMTALLFDDDTSVEEWWGDDAERTESSDPATATDEDALATLRERYARGELTDEQFERKVERLLETETLDDAVDANLAAAADDRDPEPERER